MANDPPDDAPPDLEAARVRARMLSSVFNKAPETVRIGRFEIVRLIGSGAMGLVYEVIDPKTGEHLALKTVRSQSPRILSLFKKEFRALTRVIHPNLVAFHELGRAGQHHFFTMELVRGVPLHRHLWGTEALDIGGDGLPPSPVIDFDRLRACFAQLAAAVAALHDAGKLHRDIKPTNVMVTPAGRVVLMDFGFVSEHGVSILESTQGSLVVGTPAFMPPEQSRGEKLGQSADWYGVGAALYFILTGQPPFANLPIAEALVIRESQAPPSPRHLARGIPTDLAELALALLQPLPAARPSEPEILQRLRAAPWGGAHTPARHAPLPTTARTSLVGRERELEALAEAAAGSRQGLRVVRVRGPAGIGKSALVSAFTEPLRRGDERPRILRARCSLRDAVPFQAIDGLCDALARHLRQLPLADAAALLPDHCDALLGLFPVLSQAPAFAHVRPTPAADEPTRARAFAALRELLQRFARVRPLVLWIDDLHWGDRDSALRLLGLLAPPDPPSLLVILSYRDEAGERPPALQALHALQGAHLDLAPLTPDEAAAMTGELLGERRAPALTALIAEESAGSPLWIRELARLALVDAAEPTLEAVIDRALAPLGDPAQDLLALTVVARRPLTRPLALAAGIAEADLHAGLLVLDGAHLIRRELGDDGDAALPFDDRIRVLLLGRQGAAAQRALHRRLAAALEATGAPPLLLIDHLRGAGELARAQALAVSHAEVELGAGHIHAAIDLFRIANDLGLDDAAARAIQRRLADALLAAGDEFGAAELLARIAAAGEEDAIDLRLRAARILLAHGVVDRGRPLLVDALRALDVPVLDDGQGTISALIRRGAMRLRGLRFRPRPAAEIPPRELLQADAIAIAAEGLAPFEPERAADAQERLVEFVLRLGEPARIGLALAFEALRRLAEPGDPERADALLRSVADLRARASSPHLDARLALVHLVRHHQRGDQGLARAAAAALRPALDPLPRASFERGLLRLIAFDLALLAGDVDEAERLTTEPAPHRALARTLLAQRRGDLDRARHNLAAVPIPPPTAALDLPVFLALAAHVADHQSRGDLRRAWDLLAPRWEDLRPWGLCGARLLDLRLQIAALAASPRPRERDLTALSRLRTPAAAALAAAHRGDRAWLAARGLVPPQS